MQLSYTASVAQADDCLHEGHLILSVHQSVRCNAWNLCRSSKHVQHLADPVNSSGVQAMKNIQRGKLDFQSRIALGRGRFKLSALNKNL